MSYEKYSQGFRLFNILTTYGDIWKLKIREDPNIVLEKLKQFDNDWYPYNSRKDVSRWGLSITNLDGVFGPGPDLDSLYELKHGQDQTHHENDFNVPTAAYDIVSNFCDPFKEWLSRTHILKLSAGGYFPDHIDNRGPAIDSFRLIVPLQTANASEGGYFIFDNQIINWDYGNVYFLNTCKRHTAFNTNEEFDHIVLVMNIRLTWESVRAVTKLLIP
jgi:hypothetical protein